MEEESHTLSLIKLNLGKASQWSPNGSLVDLSWKHEFQLPDGQRRSHTSTEGMTNVLNIIRCWRWSKTTCVKNIPLFRVCWEHAGSIKIHWNKWANETLCVHIMNLRFIGSREPGKVLKEKARLGDSQETEKAGHTLSWSGGLHRPSHCGLSLAVSGELSYLPPWALLFSCIWGGVQTHGSLNSL